MSAFLFGLHTKISRRGVPYGYVYTLYFEVSQIIKYTQEKIISPYTAHWFSIESLDKPVFNIIDCDEFVCSQIYRLIYTSIIDII